MASGAAQRARSRTVWVEPARLQAWLDDFAVRHRGITLQGRTAVGDDGCRAALSWWTDLATTSTPPREEDVPSPLGILLVRRGGFALARVESGRVTQEKVGRRWVQGRTAAGGWSQQRYQRRRENQAAALVDAVAGHARLILGGAAGLAVDGDQALVDGVLERVGGDVRALTSRALGGLGDPDPGVLMEATHRAARVRIDLAQTH